MDRCATTPPIPGYRKKSRTFIAGIDNFGKGLTHMEGDEESEKS
jgi:hypothetical protein